MRTKDELIAALRKKNQELIDSGGRSWSMRVPANEDDPDLLIEEACKMLEDATVWIPVSERMPTLEEGDARGKVHIKLPNGSIRKVCHFEVATYCELYPQSAWSRIEGPTS